MTTRQRAIAALLDQGWTRSELSVAFGISLPTVDRELVALRATAKAITQQRKTAESSRAAMVSQFAMAAEG